MKSILIFTLSVLIISLECYSESIHTNDTFSILPPKLTQSDDGRILTFYLKSENGFAPNVNILIRKFNGTMEEHYEKTRFQAKSLNFQIIKSSFENNQYYFEYIGKLDDNQVHFYTKYVKNGEQIYVITATSLDSDWDKKKTELIKSVNSFNLNKKSE